MQNKDILSALSLDLLRVAKGYHRGSTAMAERFLEEVYKRKQEVYLLDVDAYIILILDRMKEAMENTNIEQKAEDALMYSVLLQNYCQKKYPSTR